MTPVTSNRRMPASPQLRHDRIADQFLRVDDLTETQDVVRFWVITYCKATDPP